MITEDQFLDIWQIFKGNCPGMLFKNETNDLDGFVNYYEMLKDLEFEWLRKAAIYVYRVGLVKDRMFPPRIDLLRNSCNMLKVDAARETEKQRREREVLDAECGDSIDWVEYYRNLKEGLGAVVAQRLIEKHRAGQAQSIKAALGLSEKKLPATQTEEREKLKVKVKVDREARRRGLKLLEKEGVRVSEDLIRKVRR